MRDRDVMLLPGAELPAEDVRPGLVRRPPRARWPRAWRALSTRHGGGP